MTPILIIFGVLALATPVLLLASRKPASKTTPKLLEASPQPSLLPLINSLHAIRKEYLQLNLPSTRGVVVALTLLIEELRQVQELFEKASPEQRQRLVIEYENIGAKLEELLGEDHLLGMLTSSGGWGDPVLKVEEVEGYLKSFREEVELNREQLLEERELDFLLASALLKKRYDE